MNKITELKTSCDPKYILQNIEALQEPKNKLDYLSDTLKRCNLVPIKKKRQMSGYNCFVKVSTKKGQLFMEVIKSRAWSQLEPRGKEHWKNLANEGCSPRLWEKETQTESLKLN